MKLVNDGWSVLFDATVICFGGNEEGGSSFLAPWVIVGIVALFVCDGFRNLFGMSLLNWRTHAKILESWVVLRVSSFLAVKGQVLGSIKGWNNWWCLNWNWAKILASLNIFSRVQHIFLLPDAIDSIKRKLCLGIRCFACFDIFRPIVKFAFKFLKERFFQQYVIWFSISLVDIIDDLNDTNNLLSSGWYIQVVRAGTFNSDDENVVEGISHIVGPVVEKFEERSAH